MGAMTDDYSLLVVSDLHLSEGRDPVTGRVSRNEDFFFDDDFAAFLRYHQHSAGKWKLIINGDFIDFLQITSQPDQGASRLLTDPRYGLKTGADESVWKLQRVVKGHQPVFESLSEFALENKIAIISGNHDIEFYYPKVQTAFLEALKKSVSQDQRRGIRDNVEFLPWFYLDGNLYIEHGHQYDPLNSFNHVLDPRLPKTDQVKASEQEHIDLPLGSLFVRYLFNRVEVSTPFADNIKPATRFIGWFLTNHPIQALGFLLREGREMFGRLKSKWHWVSDSTFADRKASHEAKLEEQAVSLAEQRQSSAKEWLDRLRRLNELRTPSLMRGPTPRKWRLIRLLLGPIRTPVLMLFIGLVTTVGVALALGPLIERIMPVMLINYLTPLGSVLDPWWPILREAIRFLILLELIVFGTWAFILRRVRSGNSEAHTLRERASRIHDLLGVKYVVMGHTHEADLCNSGEDQHYFNTGTWTKVFGEEERVLREEKEFTFLRVTGTGQNRQARLMKWEGRSKAARMAYLFMRA